jgi:23S rRNA pseudouridine2457 synthase
MDIDKAPRDGLSRIAGRQPLARVLAAAQGDTVSRCAGLVRGGHVQVDGQVVHDPQFRADPFRQQITLDGQPLPLDNACQYLLFHKPYGVLCASADPEGRLTLADYIANPGVQPAGRLDLDSEGLLLLTDDGYLIHHLSHARYQHPRAYLVQVEGIPEGEALTCLRRGVVVKGQRTAPAEVELLTGEPSLPPRPVPVRESATVPTAWLRLVLTEGRKRQVRHMTAAVGHPTLRLVRTEIGPLHLGTLQPGEWRHLTPAELERLRAALIRRTPDPGRAGRPPARGLSGARAHSSREPMGRSKAGPRPPRGKGR